MCIRDSIYNRALDDFIVPAIVLLNAASSDAATQIASSEVRPEMTIDARCSDGDKGHGVSATESPNDKSYRQVPMRKLLLYLRKSLRGQGFPPGRGALPAERVPRVKAEILGMLLDPTAVVEPTPFSGKSLSNEKMGNFTLGLDNRPSKFRRRWRGSDIGGAAGLVGVLWDAIYLPLVDYQKISVPFRHRLPQRLAFLLGVETISTLEILSTALKEWDATEKECFEAAGVAVDGPAGCASEDRMVSQILVDCAVAAAEALKRGASARVENSVENCGGFEPGCEGEVLSLIHI